MRKMLKENIDMSLIDKITGLSKDKIMTLSISNLLYRTTQTRFLLNGIQTSFSIKKSKK